MGYLQRTHCPRNTVLLFCIKSLVLKADFRIFGVPDVSERQWTVQNRDDSQHKIFFQSASIITLILVVNSSGCA